MEFRILGPLEVLDGGRSITFGARKPRALLAVLVLHANEVVSTARLVEELWGERAPATAQNLVQGYVHALRKQLGGALATQPPGYVLRAGEGEVDLLEFERLREQARDLPAPAARDRLVRALSLWRGPALEDVELEGDSRHELERLNELRLATLVERIDTDLALGRHAELVGELDALVARHPLDERLRRQLMLALYGSGRQAEALEAYQQARRLLVDELGIEPSRELQAVEKAILNHDPALAVPLRPDEVAAGDGRPAEERAAPTVERSESVVVCASCGHANTPSARFCSACATPLATVPARETRKTVTVCFCDVTGSTALGERIDAEVVRRVLLRYFQVARLVIERHSGTVEKFAGDSVMAVFGVPLLHEDDALRAVRAACELRAALVTLNVELERDYGVSLEYRIGLNTGEVVTGTAERLATGDAVNVASRLEQAAQPGEVLIGEETLRLVRDAVEVENVPALALKGKGDAVRAYRLVSVGAAAPAFVRGLVGPIVGRRDELDQLRRAYERAVRDRACHLFTLLGSAGVGKSRLAAEFVASAEGATVARGRCLSYGEGITYRPVVEVVEQLLGAEPEARLAELVKEDAAASAIAALIGEDGRPASTEETAWAVRKLLEAAAASTPLIVILDDLQWGEQTFLDLVEHIADWSRGSPILLLCMARPEFLDDRPAWGGGKLYASTTLLEPLSEEETDELIELRLGTQRLAAALRARIRETAEGNPLFVEQMLALVADSPGADVRVPPTIQALLAARLDQLDPAERTVLECGAVEGRVFHRGAVRALAPQEPQLDTRLMALVRKELLRPFAAELPDEEAFRFRHELIRDAAYKALPKQARATLHERFAGWLEGHSEELTEHDELLGHHLEQAYRYRLELGPTDQQELELAASAGRRLASAGRRALARDDAPAARTLLQRAASLLPAESGERLELLPDLATALRMVDEFGEANIVLEEAIEKAIGDPRLEMHARLELVYQRTHTEPEGKTEELRRITEEAIPLFEELGDDMGLTRAWNGLGLVHFFCCQFAAAQEAFERALVHARRARVVQLERAILDNLAGTLRDGPTPVPEGMHRCAEVLEQGYGPRIDAGYLSDQAVFEAMLGHFDTARRHLARSATLLQELGTFQLGGPGWKVEMLAGDPAAAERYMRRGYDRLAATDEKSWLSTIAANLAEALSAQWRDSEAEHFIEISRTLGASDDIVTQGSWRHTQARIVARRGRLDEGERLAREAVAFFARTDMLVSRGDVLIGLADILRMSGRHRDAVPISEEAIRLYEQKGSVVSAAKAGALLGELQQPASRFRERSAGP